MTQQSLAIIGMACRFPGDVDSAAALWRLLADGRDAVGQRPPDRPELEWAGPRTGAEEIPQLGGYLRDVSSFDADFFGVPRREADVIDPQHRLLLEVAWEALEHAGLPPDRLAGTSTGLFNGLCYTEYMEALAGAPEELEGSVLANGPCVAAGRISYLLGLHGPCASLDTACSSSLVAIHLAAQALRAGECDVALAGGVTLLLSPRRTTLAFRRMGMLSPTGRCRTFDAAADGFVRAEGCGVVVVKRLSDAVRDGDRVLAVLRGSAVNQDGQSDGLAAPSPQAQRALYQMALAHAGVDPAEIGMIEAHGTGTRVGDPVEFASLATVYGAGQHRCALGSVKTNVGHLEPVSGVAGLMKAVLSLQHGQIPASLHFTRWNPAIESEAEATRFFVPAELTDWPSRTSRLAVVSSFGFSGTNAHVILEQAPTPSRTRPVRGKTPESTPDVFLMPAGSRDVLPSAAERFAGWLEGDGATVPLRDVAHTLAVRRSAGRGRLGVVARSRQDLISSLRSFAADQAHPAVVSGSVGAGIRRQPVWVFSGQGSQWPGMGRALVRQDPVFAAALTEADRLIADEAGFSVLRAVRTGEPLSGCAKVQPALFAVQTALAAMWRAHGVEPAGVIGHSMGEVAAAVVAGALSLADGVRIICRRSALLTRIAGVGAMATVALDAAAVEADLAAEGADELVSVAVLAAPGSTVVSGDGRVVAKLVAAWDARGIPARLISVDVASHSPQTDPLLDDLGEVLAGITPRQPDIPFYSTVLDDPRRTPSFDAGYWCANLRKPVRFAAAVSAAAINRHNVYIEISPHPVVTSAISGCLAGLVADPVVLSTLRRDDDEFTTFRTQLAAAHCAGVPVDWTVLYADGGLADVPFITFDRKPHWLSAVVPPAGSRPGAPDGRASGLPGTHAEVPGQRLRHAWRGDAGTAALPWLADHRVYGDPVLPGAVYCALALSAACQAFDAAAHEVEVSELRFEEMLRLGDHTEVTTTVTMDTADMDTADRAECEIFAQTGQGAWTRHASASIRKITTPPPRPPESVAALADEHSVGLDPDNLYAGMRAQGIEHGPAFTAISEPRVSRDRRSVFTRVEVPAAAEQAPSSFPVHPVLVDACAQALAGLDAAASDRLTLPAEMKAVRLHGDPRAVAYCNAWLTDVQPGSVTGQACLLDGAGNAVLSIDGLRFARHADTRPSGVEEWFYQIDWQPSPRDETADRAPEGDWLVIGEADGSAETLAGMLQATGVPAELLDIPLNEDSLGGLRRQLAKRWAIAPAPPHAVVLLCGPAVTEDPSGDTLRRTRRMLAIVQAATSFAMPPRLYVVTRQAHAVMPGDAVSLGHSALRGLVRVLSCEHPDMRATQVDIAADERLDSVAAELLSAGTDDEVAVRRGTRHVARLAPVPAGHPRRATEVTSTAHYGVDQFQLRARHVGDLDQLKLMQTPRRPLAPDEVELRVEAVGLNFRDVLTVMGLLPAAPSGDLPIGFECAGEVTAVGSAATHVRPGDKVLAIDFRGGAFGSFTTVAAAAVAAIPAGIEPSAAATLPAAFLTAWYALRHLGRLTAGERVLIHSATGGTGLAAIAVARLLGAEVLCTAGTEEKREYLRQMGIEHVMDSRSLEFTEQTLAATAGEGVDVVLNSLSGPAIRAGLETLRPFGRFIELGVRDILSDAPLGLLALRHNITLSTVDLIEVQQAHPALFAQIMREILEAIGDGHLSPLPYQTFPLGRASEAFRLMASAGHIGKLVLTVPERGEATVVRPAEPVVRPDAAYIVTGGLRGVGLETAAWLGRQGAGHIVVNGRTPPTAEAEQVLDGLRASGIRFTVALGDIAEPGTAERLVEIATADGMELRGVVHSAMVLRDSALANVTSEQFDEVWRPKVLGAWRLHEATGGHRLDWLVLYSSMASLIGNPGQGSYAAANSWLDAFAEWRSAAGLPTLAVNWGPWGETGVATGFAERGYQTIPTRAGMEALAALLASGRARAGVLPGEPRTWIPSAGQRAPLFSVLLDDSQSVTRHDGTDDIRARLSGVEPGLPRRNALEEYIADHVRAILQFESTGIDPTTPLKALGFDSMLSIELRARLESSLDIKLPGDFVSVHPTVEAMAVGLVDHMGLELG